MSAFEEQIQVERPSWFIHLRWGACGAGLVLLLVGPWVMPLNLPYGRLVVCLLSLAALNAAYLVHWKKLRSRDLTSGQLSKKSGVFLHFQMLADLALLTLMLYFSGGVGNPFFLLYLFHLAISIMLFAVNESSLYALAALLLPWSLYLLESLGMVPARWGEGVAGLSGAYGRASLGAYSLTVVGLWFFLTRLSLDLKSKEKTLRETSDKLLIACEELKQLDIYKSRFLRQVVAQLKGPVIDMDFDLSQVERAVMKKGDQALTPIHTAKKRAWTLLELVEDLVWLSHIEADDIPFHKEWIEVYDLLLTKVQALEPQARQKDIPLQLHGDPQVRLRADREAFGRVVENLISNAVKYSPAGSGPVVVEFKMLEGWLRLTVEDHGIGIPPKQRERIFEEFFRASNAKNIQKFGTGLGLSIVKRILDWHGGKVSLASEASQGTKVETLWPCLLA